MRRRGGLPLAASLLKRPHMLELKQAGIGATDTYRDVRDRNGTGLLPMQAGGDGATTFRVLGRVHTNAPWVEIKAAGTADFLECISWVPYVRLEVTAGTGTVRLWLGEQ
jgi:hypothetical protein